MKVGVADYGINCWEGALYDYEDRFLMLKEAGFEGIERLEARSPAEVIETAATAAKYGISFATCRGGTAVETLKWTAALGLNYVWTESKSNDFDEFCRQVNCQIAACEKYNIKVGLHNHLGLVVETEQQLIDFLEKCPKCGLILDGGHLSAAGGDPLKIIDKYAARLVMVHLKDYVYKDKNAKYWWDQLRFCELGAGEMGDLNKQIVKALKNKGYDGWVMIEHDTHLQNPKDDLIISREYLREAGI